MNRAAIFRPELPHCSPGPRLEPVQRIISRPCLATKRSREDSKRHTHYTSIHTYAIHKSTAPLCTSTEGNTSSLHNTQESAHSTLVAELYVTQPQCQVVTRPLAHPRRSNSLSRSLSRHRLSNSPHLEGITTDPLQGIPCFPHDNFLNNKDLGKHHHQRCRYRSGDYGNHQKN